MVLNGIGLVLDLVNVFKAAYSLAALNMVFNLAGWLLAAYLFLVVLSYVREMHEEEEEDVVAGDEECFPDEIFPDEPRK